MFCEHCGNFIDEGSRFCNICGKRVAPEDSNPIDEGEEITSNPDPISSNGNNRNNNFSNKNDVVYKTQDKANIWLVIIAFFIPIVGLILFVALKKNTPKKANAIGIAALIGFVLGFIISIFAVIFVMIVTFASFDSYYNDYDNYNERLYRRDPHTEDIIF